MKRIFRYFAILASVCIGTLMSSCSNELDIVESLDLTRCLTPLNLNVKIIDGDQVTFRWDAVKGADQYQLEIYSDEQMKNLVKEELVLAKELPATIKMDADSEYWFRVKAIDSSEKLEPSKWAVYSKSVKTYAVKPTVYPAVKDRTSTSITVSWDVEAAAGEINLVKWVVLGSEEVQERELTAEEIAAGEATVTGLESFTNYVVSVYFKSANRGDLSIWTRANTDGYTEITTEAALKQAATDGGKYVLKMDASPYYIGATDIANGFEIVGEEAADGTQPVILGEYHVLNSVANDASFIFKSVELNGNGGEFGFAFQLKNGGAGKGQLFDKIHFLNCKITGYTKGLIYEWGGTFGANELIWDGCTIVEVNKANTQGGDGIDFRGASDIKKLHIVNNTIYNGFRTFFRIDAATILGEVKINNNTIMNLSKDDASTNNNGILGVKAKPASIEFKNNLILYMDGNAKLNGPAAQNLNTSDLGITFASNYFHSITAASFFNDKTTQAEALAGGGKILEVDPCYKAKAGIFNVSDSDLINGKIGAPKWLMAFNKKPEDLTMTVVEGAHKWDFKNPAYFLGTIDEKMVRDQLFLGVVDNKINISEDGILQFLVPTTVNRQKLPLDGYLAFMVDKPGSVYIKPVNINDKVGNHVIIGKGDVKGEAISIKGGAAANVDNEKAQKIVIRDITEPSLIYVYASEQIGLAELGWAYDTTAVNTALPTPVVSIDPKSVKADAPKEVVITWDPVENAASYSVMFSGKTYDVEECTYTISTDIIKFLDPGAYSVSVFANPSEEDIYNTQSAAGTASFAVQAAGGEAGSEEFIVNNVEELVNAINSGKTDITLANTGSVHEIGAMDITTPLHLKGQTVDGVKTQVKANFTISGEIAGSFILENLDIDGTGAAGSLVKETAPVTIDTVGFININYHDASKALYDNSGKQASCVQWLIFDGVHAKNASAGSDFIDMRNGHYHNVIVRRSTFENSCRTFIRTDAASEVNNILIRNNTFYKVCLADSKDNNGVLHVRSTGIQTYSVLSNFFYSVPVTTASTASNANGYPKFVSTNAASIVPSTIMNNYFYNVEENFEGHLWFSTKCPKEAAINGGGAVIYGAEPMKNPESGDFTLVNGVAINAGVGDPRWNPQSGSTPSSEITVETVADLLTAISANKSVITLKSGEYDLTVIEDNPDIATGVLTVYNSLSLIGENGAVVKGGFKMGDNVKTFSIEGITFDGNNSIGNFIEIPSENVDMSSLKIKSCNIKAYKNRFIYQNVLAKVSSLEIINNIVSEMGTGGDFIDFRKGSLTAVKISNNTFVNGIRTFTRIDASVELYSMVVKNNTFSNLCFVDSKDNNGIFHVRATSIDTVNFKVQNNLFANMVREAEAPSQTNGYPKIVSTNTAGRTPQFSKNYYYNVNDVEGDYSWWSRINKTIAANGYGIVLTEDPFKDAANGDYTLVNNLAASERIGDPRWNTNSIVRPGDPYPVNDLASFINAIDAGKTVISLAYGEYDLTADETLAGALTLNNSLTIIGQTRDGKLPRFIGKFNLNAADGATFSISKVELDGNNALDNLATLSGSYSNVSFLNCNIKNYKNRFIYISSETANGGSINIMGNLVSDMGTSGDCIDIRKGTVAMVKAVNNTWWNGIRTFIRMDAATVCQSVLVKNNTFYNLCSVDSKDNNGIFHVRASATVIAEKNLFAAMKRAEETPTQANGYPKLVSQASSKIKLPIFRDNLYYNVDETASYDWFGKVDEASSLFNYKAKALENGGQQLTAEQSPFVDETKVESGLFNIKAEYKGYGDLRW